MLQGENLGNLIGLAGGMGVVPSDDFGQELSSILTRALDAFCESSQSYR